MLSLLPYTRNKRHQIDALSCYIRQTPQFPPLFLTAGKAYPRVDTQLPYFTVIFVLLSIAN